MTADTYAARAATAEGRRGLARAAARYRAVEMIGEILETEHISQRDLAERLGKSESAVSQVLGGDRNLTLNTLADYLDALHHRLEMHAVRAVEGMRPVDLTETVGLPSTMLYGHTPTVAPYRTDPGQADGLA
jgi:antitoxin component HigA of HigAB toxin-antitoxin module